MLGGKMKKIIVVLLLFTLLKIPFAFCGDFAEINRLIQEATRKIELSNKIERDLNMLNVIGAGLMSYQGYGQNTHYGNVSGTIFLGCATWSLYFLIFNDYAIRF